MKSPKIKLVDQIFRWDGISYERGSVLKKGKLVTIRFPDGSIKIKKEEIKWQKRYLYDKKQWTAFRWITSAKNIIQVPVEKIEGDWIKTYGRAGTLVSMKLTEEAHKEIFWFLRDPHEFMLEQGYSVSEERIKQLQFFGDEHWPTTYTWFDCSVRDRSHGEEFIKWMIGPLAELMIEHEITDMRWGTGLPFHGAALGLLVEKVINKEITATMGKDVLRRMFDGDELEKILEDDKYKISSGDDMLKFVKDTIEANPEQVEELKAGKEKILMWLVGQVMKASRGKANAAEVKEMLIKELNL